MSTHVPKYRLHKGSGQALVQINGERIYLGKHGTPESEEKYQRLIAEWLAALHEQTQGKVATPSTVSRFDLTINEVVLAYIKFARGYYVKDGKPTKEFVCMKHAVRTLLKLYGTIWVRDFGPLALKAIREHMIAVEKLSRGVVNHRINRIKRVFKWAVSEELIPTSVHEGLRSVGGLRYGRTEARETEPVKPVADDIVEGTLPFVPPQIAAMIQLQRLTGMRPCEVTIVRPCDIDRTDPVWIYTPHDHKNRWRGHRKEVPLGPKAQAVILPFLDRSPEAFCFSPQEAMEWRQQNRALHFKKSRKTPVYPSELRARERAKLARRKRTPKRAKRERYDTDSYRRAITYGQQRARKAGVELPHWHPNQLRHTRGTEVRKKFGIEAAQVALGHARADVTQVYAERNSELARKIAMESG
jgi:integrase